MAAQVIDPELHPLDAVARCLGEAAQAFAGLPEGPLPPADTRLVGATLETTTMLERRLGELRLRLSRTAEESRAAESTAASDTGAWLARLTGSSAAVMRGGLWLGRMLEERYPAVRNAFASGALGEAHPGSSSGPPSRCPSRSPRPNATKRWLHWSTPRSHGG